MLVVMEVMRMIGFKKHGSHDNKKKKTNLKCQKQVENV